MRRLADPALRLGDVHAPGDGVLRPDAEERQRRFVRDELAEQDREHDHHRRERVRQDVPQHDAPVARAQHARGLHVVLVARRDHRRAHHARRLRPAEQAERQHHRPDAQVLRRRAPWRRPPRRAAAECRARCRHRARAARRASHRRSRPAGRRPARSDPRAASRRCRRAPTRGRRRSRARRRRSPACRSRTSAPRSGRASSRSASSWRCGRRSTLNSPGNAASSTISSDHRAGDPEHRIAPQVVPRVADRLRGANRGGLWRRRQRCHS